MSNIKRFAGIILGAALAGGAVAAWRLYDDRPRERYPSPEGIESPDVAKAFARISALPQMELLRRFVAAQALALCSTGEAADLGCGSGQLAIELAQAAPDLRVTGIDLSYTLLSEALHNAAEAGLAHRVDFRTGDAAAAPFDDASLDLVVSTLSLHHWSDPVTVLDETARILRPGGSFVIFDLRRDMIMPAWLLLWFASRLVVPKPLRYIGEPLGSRNASYTVQEAARLAQASRLTGWHVTGGPFWLSIEGTVIG
jgi:ubiquinone/menaquinone biosynthesis C-methylase UbiE